MGWFSGLLNLGKTQEKVVDSITDIAKMGASGIDVLFHTDEEKSQENIAARKEWMAYILKRQETIGQSDSASSKARRNIAYAITGVVLATFVYLVVILSIGYLRAPIVDGVLIGLERYKLLVVDIVSLANRLYIGEAFAAVLTTFLVYYGWNKVKNK